jgi:hypothetical protein
MIQVSSDQIRFVTLIYRNWRIKLHLFWDFCLPLASFLLHFKELDINDVLASLRNLEIIHIKNYGH